MPSPSRILIRALLCLLIALPSTAQAMQAKRGSQVTHDQGAFPLTIRIEGGYLWGQSEERVYAVYEGGQRKLSELLWKLENVYMLGGVVSAEPVPWLQVNVGFWSRVNRGAGTMDDFDWTDPQAPGWDMWSQSDILLKRGRIFDVNVQGRLFEYQGLGLWVMAGFKYSNWYWSDRGKFHVYSQNGFRDDIGGDGGINGIDYEQWFHTPYAGVSLTYDLGRLHLTSYLTYSPLAWARDRDHHLLRPKVCDGRFDHIRYLGVGVQATVDLTENIFVGAAFDYQQYAATRGTGTQRFPDMDMVISMSDLAGIEHYSHMVSFTVGYRF